MEVAHGGGRALPDRRLHLLAVHSFQLPSPGLLAPTVATSLAPTTGNDMAKLRPPAALLPSPRQGRALPEPIVAVVVALPVGTREHDVGADGGPTQFGCAC
jgi:hypothetical protein